ncbi:hypothetical protein FAES_2608 [Fibrella aestuarina BUZ 2]|uniref:Uncharacterized protein n=1 Tax=Fibrella aestuarina BUZ 2 TaxID=1166018 RepID=I0K914_9BACT|nr:hypothetical protein [Fibrella aestuarina]CCH00617.1 hypothetical protein FAES_2608 [Fibrella aestuarina BUZ 2]
MEPKQQQWINDVLGSLDGLQRAEPSPFLYAKIRNRLNGQPVAYAPKKLVWLVAASFALLALLNWRLVASSTVPTNVPSESASLRALASEWQLYPTHQLYGE